jgi:hypothetical protein
VELAFDGSLAKNRDGYEKPDNFETSLACESFIPAAEMMNDGEITRERALELARMVLRENAIKLYNLQTQ